jgi:cysteine desulfurase/selenocysteine lyase
MQRRISETDDSFVSEVRKDFQVLSKMEDGNPIVYLDSAATTLTPVSVISEITRYYSSLSTNVHRGKSYLMEEASDAYEECRHRFAEWIGCSGNEIVFVRNTTEAINLVYYGMGLMKTDLVVACESSHHANLLPWINHGNVELVRTTNEELLDIGHFRQLMKKRPKLVAITHCSNVDGSYLPVEELAKIAKAHGATVLVDTAQSVPHRSIRVDNMDADFITFSSHKMLGPTGFGVLFGKADKLKLMRPMILGGGMVDWVDTTGFQPRKIPHRFEAGTPHIAGAFGARASLDYLDSIGILEIAKHDRRLAAYMGEKATERDYVKVVGATVVMDKSAIVSMSLSGIEKLDDVARMLSDSYGVVCRTGHLCAQPLISQKSTGEVLRISGYVYTTFDEIDTFFHALDDIYSVFR